MLEGYDEIYHQVFLSSGIIFCFLFPILQLTCFYLAIGGNPRNLNIGIVNQEVMNFQDCANSSLITATAQDDSCDLYKISCRFIEELGDDLAKKVSYGINSVDSVLISCPFRYTTIHQQTPTQRLNEDTLPVISNLERISRSRWWTFRRMEDLRIILHSLAERFKFTWT